MCTVTYIPGVNRQQPFFITSNRDESVYRPAEAPQVYEESGNLLFYPKDKKAGGSWIGLSRRKRLMTLMNGAFQRYDIHRIYRKSRGVVLKEILLAEDALETVEQYDFRDVAPFFCLFFTWASGLRIFEIAWDGERIYLNQKDERKPEIWSSRMSYSQEQHHAKQRRFEKLLKSHDRWTPDLLWDFHHEEGSPSEEGMLIKRGDFRTTYICQYQNREEGDFFRFEDLLSDREESESIQWREE